MPTIGPMSKDKVLQDLSVRHYVLNMFSRFWFHDFYFAKSAAANKPDGPGSGVILAYFSGSDWCIHCQHLDEEVFKSSTFLNWFKMRLMVPYLADTKLYSPQPPNYVWQVTELDMVYSINAWPQVLALKADGSEIGRLEGYADGSGPDKWIQEFSAMSGVM